MTVDENDAALSQILWPTPGPGDQLLFLDREVVAVTGIQDGREQCRIVAQRFLGTQGDPNKNLERPHGDAFSSHGDGSSTIVEG